jgi:hypothetical protein
MMPVHQYPSRVYGEPFMPAIFGIIGLALNLMGVIVLFRYGMPYRVRTGGDTGSATVPGETSIGECRDHGGQGVR